MENNPQPVQNRRKFLITAFLLLVLVVFPALSWLYLRGGLNWRKEALAELGNYGKIRAVNMIFPGNDKVNRVESAVCVVHSFGADPDLSGENKFILDTGQRLFEQFGSNMNFRLVMIAQGGTAEFKTHAQTLPSADYATWVWTGALGSWSTILNNGYESYCIATGNKGYKEFYALTDTSGTIRRFYNALDEKEVGRMVEQIAILLPKE
jgi:hypothetical protein